jgi:hypothetical protein
MSNNLFKVIRFWQNINLKTAPEDFSSVEKAKLSTNGLTIAVKDRNSQSNLYTQLRDTDFEEL